MSGNDSWKATDRSGLRRRNAPHSSQQGNGFDKKHSYEERMKKKSGFRRLRAKRRHNSPSQATVFAHRLPTQKEGVLLVMEEDAETGEEEAGAQPAPPDRDDREGAGNSDDHTTSSGNASTTTSHSTGSATSSSPSPDHSVTAKNRAELDHALSQVALLQRQLVEERKNREMLCRKFDVPLGGAEADSQMTTLQKKVDETLSRRVVLEENLSGTEALFRHFGFLREQEEFNLLSVRKEMQRRAEGHDLIGKELSKWVKSLCSTFSVVIENSTLSEALDGLVDHAKREVGLMEATLRKVVPVARNEDPSLRELVQQAASSCTLQSTQIRDLSATIAAHETQNASQKQLIGKLNLQSVAERKKNAGLESLIDSKSLEIEAERRKAEGLVLEVSKLDTSVRNQEKRIEMLTRRGRKVVEQRDVLTEEKTALEVEVANLEKKVEAHARGIDRSYSSLRTVETEASQHATLPQFHRADRNRRIQEYADFCRKAILAMHRRIAALEGSVRQSCSVLEGSASTAEAYSGSGSRVGQQQGRGAREREEKKLERLAVTYQNAVDKMNVRIVSLERKCKAANTAIGGAIEVMESTKETALQSSGERAPARGLNPLRGVNWLAQIHKKAVTNLAVKVEELENEVATLKNLLQQHQKAIRASIQTLAQSKPKALQFGGETPRRWESTDRLYLVQSHAQLHKDAVLGMDEEITRLWNTIRTTTQTLSQSKDAARICSGHRPRNSLNKLATVEDYATMHSVAVKKMDVAVAESIQELNKSKAVVCAALGLPTREQRKRNRVEEVVRLSSLHNQASETMNQALIERNQALDKSIQELRESEPIVTKALDRQQSSSDEDEVKRPVDEVLQLSKLHNKAVKSMDRNFRELEDRHGDAVDAITRSVDALSGSEEQATKYSDEGRNLRESEAKIERLVGLSMQHADAVPNMKDRAVLKIDSQRDRIKKLKSEKRDFQFRYRTVLLLLVIAVVAIVLGVAVYFLVLAPATPNTEGIHSVPATTPPKETIATPMTMPAVIPETATSTASRLEETCFVADVPKRGIGVFLKSPDADSTDIATELRLALSDIVRLDGMIYVHLLDNRQDMHCDKTMVTALHQMADANDVQKKYVVVAIQPHREAKTLGSVSKRLDCYYGKIRLVEHWHEDNANEVAREIVSYLS